MSLIERDPFDDLASYKNGILEIRVPKSERAKPKQVKVEDANE